MNNCLERMSSKKAKVDALKLQINFRKKVLGQVHADKSVFQFSSNLKPLSVDQLAQNLSLLFSAGSSPHELCLDNLRKDPELLLYRRIEHLFECDGEDMWFKGTVLSYEKEESCYTVAYDDEEEVHSFPLLQDFEKGEVRLIS